MIIQKAKTFKEKVPLHKRKKLVEMIQIHHPTKIPVILESKTIELELSRVLVPDNITIASFLKKIRNHLRPDGSMSDQTACYLITDNNILLSPSDEISIIYSRHREKCGFLFLHIEKENLYG